MTEKFTVRSKIHVKPKKSARAFVVFFNICLTLYLIKKVLEIVMYGFNVEGIFPLGVNLAIAIAINKLPSFNAHYEAAIADISVSDEEIVINYRQVEGYKHRGYVYTIPVSTVSVLEFSGTLGYLHICGIVKGKLLDKKAKETQSTDYFLYMEKGQEGGILNAIEKVVNVPIKYMDLKE